MALMRSLHCDLVASMASSLWVLSLLISSFLVSRIEAFSSSTAFFSDSCFALRSASSLPCASFCSLRLLVSSSTFALWATISFFSFSSSSCSDLMSLEESCCSLSYFCLWSASIARTWLVRLSSSVSSALILLFTASRSSSSRALFLAELPLVAGAGTGSLGIAAVLILSMFFLSASSTSIFLSCSLFLARKSSICFFRSSICFFRSAVSLESFGSVKTLLSMMALSRICFRGGVWGCRFDSKRSWPIGLLGGLLSVAASAIL